MAKKKSSGKKKTKAAEETVPEEKQEETIEKESAPETEAPEETKEKKPKKSKGGKKKKKEEKPPETPEEAVPEDMPQEKAEKKKKKPKKTKAKEKEEPDVEAPAPEEKAEEKPPEEKKEDTKKEKESPVVDEDDEYAIVILGWATAGYDTSQLENSLSKGDKKTFKKDFERFQKGVARTEEIKKEIETLNIAGVEKEVDELLKLLQDPLHIRRAENYFEKVKKLIHAKDLEVELDTMMSVDSLRGRAEDLKKDLQDPDNIDDVEEQMKDLRREFKEEYALNQFMELIDEKPREVKRIKVTEEVRKTSNPMVVKDLFVFTSSGKYIATKTVRPDAKDPQVKKGIIEKLNKAKEIIGNPNVSTGMSLKIPAGDETLLVHKGEHVAIGLIISGVPHKLTGKLLKKGVGMMEREDADAIAKWSPGQKKVNLPHVKKNMNAIMYAAMKLGDEMKK